MAMAKPNVKSSLKHTSTAYDGQQIVLVTVVYSVTIALHTFYLIAPATEYDLLNS